MKWTRYFSKSSLYGMQQRMYLHISLRPSLWSRLRQWWHRKSANYAYCPCCDSFQSWNTFSVIDPSNHSSRLPHRVFYFCPCCGLAQESTAFFRKVVHIAYWHISEVQQTFLIEKGWKEWKDE